MHAVAAQEAMRERRFEDAAAAAQRAIDANPSNAGAYTVLGGASLQLNKCREAVRALERVLEVALIGHSAIPELLAQAYVCAGDTANAKRLLRRRGFPEARLDAEIAHLQELASRRRAQKPR
jgi:lipopolysaccharide biosynthesis regulator YciM